MAVNSTTPNCGMSTQTLILSNIWSDSTHHSLLGFLMIKCHHMTDTEQGKTVKILFSLPASNLTVRDFLCPSHLIPIDLNVIRNWVQFLVMRG